MTPQYQTIFSDKDKKTRGNCLQACVASLLDLPINKVPDFASYGNDFIIVLKNFCDINGYRFSGIILNPSVDELFTVKGVDGFFIIGGKSPRGDYGHAVIYKNGLPYFDPNPSNKFTENVNRIYLISKR